MKADVNKLAYIGRKPASGILKRDSDSWFTPELYTDLVRKVLGGIDLDPFSSISANEHVKAARFFDINMDAFKQIWFKKSGTVFMNPPYSKKLIGKAVNTFIFNLENNSISQAVVLVNNATETKWFQTLSVQASALCLVHKRIHFENVDGKNISGNTRGQIFLYYGSDKLVFTNIFNEIGSIVYTNKIKYWSAQSCFGIVNFFTMPEVLILS
jgi:phage N-6-adenine-methyltransferase